MDVIQRLSLAVEYRDSETRFHTMRMSNYCVCLATKTGISMEESDQLLTASPLHDIGKIGIPDSILLKPKKLTANETEIMKSHTIIGGEILSGSSSKFLKLGREIALSHHEKWDGTGYPYGLKGSKIPITGRICAICDAFDAITSNRPYRTAKSDEYALEEIKRSSGTYFDPNLVNQFIEILPQILSIKDKYQDANST